MDSNRYVHPNFGAVGRLAERFANSHLLRKLRRNAFGHLPFPVLASDVVDVVYATWLVDATRAKSFAPPRAQLLEKNGLTPFTILTYRHGHFGPRAAGPLRVLFPSPLQSNWRLYLGTPMPDAPNCPTVAFVKNTLDNAIYALGTRVFSDALPSHFARHFTFAVDEREVNIKIDPETGSAPALAAQFDRTSTPALPANFSDFAGSWEAAVRLLASQDAAVVWAADIERTAVATISLPLDISSVRPLQLRPERLECQLLHDLGALTPSLSFLLPRVHFQALSERLL